jgi:predicted metal-dependent hydrolase
MATMPQLQFKLAFGRKGIEVDDERCLHVGGRRLRLWLVRNRRARRYILRLRPDGGARLTVPSGGNEAEAMRFAIKNAEWLERQLLRQATRPAGPDRWRIGTEILFRGEAVRLESGLEGGREVIRFGQECLTAPDARDAVDLRPLVERHLRRLAERELPSMVLDLAGQHQLPVKRVMVRNQRSRWGSCSRRGTVSLNWRLVQIPLQVRDYIVLHELAHLKEMNHSRKFWQEVGRLCPRFAEAKGWLKRHSRQLLSA